MRIIFCVVSWTVFVRVVFTDLVRTQQARDVPAVTLLQPGEWSDSREDGHSVRLFYVATLHSTTEKKNAVTHHIQKIKSKTSVTLA